MEKLTRLVGMMTLAMLLLVGCSKENDAAMDDQQTAQDDVLVDGLQNSVELLIETNIDDSAIDGVLAVSPQLKVMAQPYPHVDVELPEEGGLWPRIVTIDFGPENIEVSIGNPNVGNSATVLVRGSIVVTKTGPFFSIGSERSAVTNGLYINNYLVDLTSTCITRELNNSGHYLFDVTSVLEITDSKGNTFTRNAAILREMTNGSDTPATIWDDVFVINGTATGQRISGLNYTHTISQLEIKRSCQYPVSGSVTVTNRYTSFEIDYGQGECDNKFVLTDENGHEYGMTIN